MKKALTMTNSPLYHQDGVRKDGPHTGLLGDCTDLWGDCTGLLGDCTDLWGDCTGLWGDCTGLWGNCTGLRGYCTDLWGDCSGLRGNLDDCGLAAADRERGVNIRDLAAQRREGE